VVDMLVRPVLFVKNFHGLRL